MRIFGLDIRRAGDLSDTVDVRQLHSTLKRLEIDLAGVKDELSQLQGHHLKLRKQFDGSKGGRPREADIEPGDKAARKAQLRARIGLVPGRPAQINPQE